MSFIDNLNEKSQPKSSDRLMLVDSEDPVQVSGETLYREKKTSLAELGISEVEADYTINPGDDPQAVFDAAPEGSHIHFTRGTHEHGLGGREQLILIEKKCLVTLADGATLKLADNEQGASGLHIQVITDQTLPNHTFQTPAGNDGDINTPDIEVSFDAGGTQPDVTDNAKTYLAGFGGQLEQESNSLTYRFKYSPTLWGFAEGNNTTGMTNTLTPGQWMAIQDPSPTNAGTIGYVKFNGAPTGQDTGLYLSISAHSYLIRIGDDLTTENTETANTIADGTATSFSYSSLSNSSEIAKEQLIVTVQTGLNPHLSGNAYLDHEPKLITDFEVNTATQTITLPSAPASDAIVRITSSIHDVTILGCGSNSVLDHNFRGQTYFCNSLPENICSHVIAWGAVKNPSISGIRTIDGYRPYMQHGTASSFHRGNGSDIPMSGNTTAADWATVRYSNIVSSKVDGITADKIRAGLLFGMPAHRGYQYNCVLKNYRSSSEKGHAFEPNNRLRGCYVENLVGEFTRTSFERERNYALIHGWRAPQGLVIHNSALVGEYGPLTAAYYTNTPPNWYRTEVEAEHVDIFVLPEPEASIKRGFNIFRELNIPSWGKNLELHFNPSNDRGVINSIDRDTNSFLGLNLNALITYLQQGGLNIGNFNASPSGKALEIGYDPNNDRAEFVAVDRDNSAARQDARFVFNTIQLDGSGEMDLSGTYPKMKSPSMGASSGLLLSGGTVSSGRLGIQVLDKATGQHRQLYIDVYDAATGTSQPADN